MNSVNKKTKVNNTRTVILATIGAAVIALLSHEANRLAFTMLYNLIGHNAENIHMCVSYMSSVISFVAGIIITVIFGAFVCKEKSDWLKFIVSVISGRSLGEVTVNIILSISTAAFIKTDFYAEDTHIISYIATASLIVFSALFTAVIISAFMKSEEKEAPAYIAEVKTDEVQISTADEVVSSPKSRGISIVLCIFLGWLGIHRFYTGKVATGILWLFTGGLFGIGILVDLVMLIFKVYTDSDGLLVE